MHVKSTYHSAAYGRSTIDENTATIIVIVTFLLIPHLPLGLRIILNGRCQKTEE